MTGGDVRLKASDDGINAAGRSGGTEAYTGPAQDSFRQGTERFILITGGALAIDAQGDGIDSNGDVAMEGGLVLVNDPTGGGDGAPDYDGTFSMEGGTLIAAGSAGMLQAPGYASSRPSLEVVCSSTLQAGPPLTLTDADERVIAAFALEKDYQSVVVSSPTLEIGQTYALYTGGQRGGRPRLLFGRLHHRRHQAGGCDPLRRDDGHFGRRVRGEPARRHGRCRRRHGPRRLRNTDAARRSLS